MEFRSPYHPHHRSHHQSEYRKIGTGQTIGVIDGKAYGAANVFVIRSLNNSNAGGYGGYHRRLESPPPTKPRARQEVAVSRAPPPSSSSSSWLDHRQLKRRKRIAKYKMYAYEGKVKSSFKNGVRWIKRACSKIANGF